MNGSKVKYPPLDASDRVYLSMSIILAILTAGIFIVFLILSGYPKGTISPDGPGYVSVTEYFKGENVELSKWRVSRPIIPILALPLSYLLNTQLSFILVNAILFVLLVILFYFIAKELLGEPLHAFYANLLLIFAFPIYYRGINVTADLASWLIFVCISYLILYSKKEDIVTIKVFSIIAAFCAIGTLVTELVLASFLLVFFQYLFETFNKKSHLKIFRDLIIIGLSFTIPFIIIQLLIYLIFDYSIFDKANRQMDWFANNPLNLGFMGLIRILIGTFSVSLLFLPMGILEFWQNKRYAKLHLAMFVSIMLTLFAVYTNSIRFAFVLFPLVFTFNIRGIFFIISKLQFVISATQKQVQIARLTLVVIVCTFNIVLYFAFLRFGSTTAIAKHLLSFML
jgi:hypothetical protein